VYCRFHIAQNADASTAHIWAELSLTTPNSAVLLRASVGSLCFPVRLGAIDNILRELGVDSNIAVLHGLGSGALARPLVGRQVEADEQDEVAAQDTAARESSELLTSAAAGIGHPGPVGGGEVSVRREVNKSYIEGKQNPAILTREMETNRGQ
jgi:hypothetical protein